MTPTMFWIVSALLVIAALGLVIVPLWRGAGRDTGTPRSDANIAVYRRQLADLDQELQDGVVDRASYDAARLELERRLLSDVSTGDDDAVSADASTTGQPRRRLRVAWPLLTIVIVLPVMTVAIYYQVGMTPGTVQTFLENPGEMPESMFREMLADLRVQVSQDPENAEAWHMLGRGYARMDDLERATEALSRARELRNGRDPAVLTDLAQVLAMQQPGGSLQGEPRRLLESAVDINGDYVDALWLSGLAAAEAGEVDLMRRRWDHLLELVEGTPEEEMVRGAIMSVLNQQQGRGQDNGESAGGLLSQ